MTVAFTFSSYSSSCCTFADFPWIHNRTKLISKQTFVFTSFVSFTQLITQHTLNNSYFKKKKKRPILGCFKMLFVLFCFVLFYFKLAGKYFFGYCQITEKKNGHILLVKGLSEKPPAIFHMLYCLWNTCVAIKVLTNNIWVTE